ncbi:MAG: L,D-transpeptidase [Pseudomonadota bacterium]
MYRRTFVRLSLCALGAGCTATVAPGPQEPQWRKHFASLQRDAILINTDERMLHYWRQGGAEYRAYPVGVAESPELLRTGQTHVVAKEVDPAWGPTPAMLRRNPNLPRYIPPGPDNPLGSHSLHLSWKYYQIHGTDDPASVGRKSTSGCFRLMNAHVETLYRLVRVGTPVVVV